MAHTRTAEAVDRAAVANGPEGGPGRRARPARGVGMRTARDNVRRLRQRIFKAAQAGDHKKVRNLQKLMLRSHSNTLVSVERVTEHNAGRVTAGVDGEVALTDEARAELVARVPRQARTWQPRPVKRTYIPKPGAGHKLRPLGIPVIFDRVLQARVKNALEPEWEARFEIRSYGFRPGRGCHDAIEVIFNTLRGRNARRLWILDADLTAAFDRIDHSQLVAALGSFPGRGPIGQWLKAGVVEPGKGFTPTEEGTPQGGIISPALLNVALHGLEAAAGVRYQTGPAHIGWVRDLPILVRYADDFIVACHSQRQAEQVQARLAEWLAARGLALNEDKTPITHASRGFDFLGFNIRRYPNGKLLIKPSTAAIKRIRKRLREVFQTMLGASARELIQTLNPIISGWAAYYRTAVSSGAFSRWTTTCGSSPQVGHTPPPQQAEAVDRRPLLRPVPPAPEGPMGARRPRQRRLPPEVLLDQDRPAPAGHRRSVPDDPALADYWARRRRKQQPPLGEYALYQLQRQHGRCPLCGDYLLHADHAPTSTQEWAQWFRVTRKAISKHSLKIVGSAEPGTPDRNRIHLVHTRCRRLDPRGGTGPALLRRRAQPTRLA